MSNHPTENEPPVSSEDTPPRGWQPPQDYYARANDGRDPAPYDAQENAPFSTIEEPAVDPMADTNPIGLIYAEPISAWRRTVGILSLIGAGLFTVGTALLLLSGGETNNPSVAILPTAEPANITTDALPTAIPVVGQPDTQPDTTDGQIVRADIPALPIMDTAAMSRLLNQPPQPLLVSNPLETVRNIYDPFTIIPDRPRGEVIQYEVQSGDTIFSIAERYGLKPESIAWANDRAIITAGLRPGRILNILPVDGAYFTVPDQATIGEIAVQFGVTADAIIDSEFNNLFGTNADTVLTSGTAVVVPGGEAEQISWNPVVERVGADGSGSGGQISFSTGEPGSCGLVDNPGGSGAWTNPLGGAGVYQWMQGFSSFHTGVDLSASTGTPVYAANGGTVIFAGLSNFGYGYAIVLAHGPFTTVYGHLSAINVGCGQSVGAGQAIGGVGSTGNSSGPHLHFEVRYNDVPQDPISVMAL